MVIELLPYILLFLLSVGNVIKNSKLTNDIFFFCLFSFSAIRYGVGFDFFAYDELIKEGAGFSVNRIEPIERWLIGISHEYYHQLFFIVNSFITVYFMKWALQKKSLDLSLSSLMFLSFPLMFTNSFSIIRFWSALSIIFYASLFLEEKKYIKFLALVLLATFFHYSALIALLFIPLYLFEVPLLINIIILIFGFVGGEFILNSILSGIFPENFLADRLVVYANREGSDGLSKIPYLYLFFDILFLLKAKDIVKYSKSYYTCVTIYNIGVTLLFLLSFQTTLATRISRPFLIYILLLIPFLIEFKHFPKKYRISQVLILGFIIFAFLLYIYNLSIYNLSLGRSQFLPYKIYFYEN